MGPFFIYSNLPHSVSKGFGLIANFQEIGE
jgi:hypothetical protein